jgi:hypothetical protein
VVCPLNRPNYSFEPADLCGRRYSGRMQRQADFRRTDQLRSGSKVCFRMQSVWFRLTNVTQMDSMGLGAVVVSTRRRGRGLRSETINLASGCGKFSRYGYSPYLDLRGAHHQDAVK